MARGSQRRPAQNNRRGGTKTARRDETGIIPVLARVVREVEAAVARRSAMPDVRTKFQVVALLAREERARVRADDTLSDARRGEELKRLDGIATILAQTAASDPRLFDLLAEDAEISDSALDLKRDLQRRAGYDVPDPEPEPVVDLAEALAERRAIPQSVIARQLANPFLVPDFEAATPVRKPTGRLATWELLGPLFRSFEDTTPGAPVCMDLPRGARDGHAPAGSRADGAPGADGRGRRRGAPHVPARRRARPRQDRPGAARRADRRGLPAAGRGAQRRQDQLGPRGRAVDPEPPRDGAAR